MNNLKSLIQILRRDGYDKVSLPELAFHYRRQYNASIDIEELKKALVSAGIWSSYFKGDILTLSALPVMPQFNKLPINETTKVLKSNVE